MFRALPFAREQLPSIRKATEALADGGQDRSVRSNRSSVGLVGRPVFNRFSRFIHAKIVAPTCARRLVSSYAMA
eukprot:1801121-Pyramimonas_sp.AAC.1